MADAPPEAMEEGRWTCGMGLAQQSVVPAGIADLLRALTEILETHLPTIDTGDESGQLEAEAYTYLSGEFASISAHLGRGAATMGSYRDLPPAGHHEEALADPALLEPFRNFVAIETELADLLTRAAREDGRLLAELDS